jgi:hypothetical protein
MKTHPIVLVGGAALLALGMCYLAAGAADGDKDPSQVIQKVADAIEKGDTAQAKKMAEVLAKSAELEPVMDLMSLRKASSKKKTFGVGDTPGKITPDGIEAKVMGLGKKALQPKQLETESPALVKMAYRVAAISKVAQAKVPEKDEGMKKKKDWIEWSQGMEMTALELANAAKAKDTAKVKTAAARLNSNCNNCHGTFRD